MPSRYANYSVNDFDRFDCLRLSKIFYLLLTFVLRGYLVWIMSVTNMQDRAAIVQSLYPEPPLFYLSLLSGVFGLFLVLLMSLRKPGAANWVKVCWSYSRTIAVFALVFDLAINAIAYWFWQMQSLHWLFMQFIIVCLLITFCFTNQRYQINLTEFPETLSDDSASTKTKLKQ